MHNNCPRGDEGEKGQKYYLRKLSLKPSQNWWKTLIYTSKMSYKPQVVQVKSSPHIDTVWTTTPSPLPILRCPAGG